MRLIRFISGRVTWYLAVFLVLALTLFWLLHVLAGDQFAPPGQKRSDGESALAAQQHREWGLDRPLLLRFASWAWASLRLGFGVSIWSLEKPDAYWWDAAMFDVRAQMRGTLLILAASALLVWGAALPWGARAAARPTSASARAARVITRAFGSMPGFLLALGMLVVVSLLFHGGRLGLRFDTPHDPYRLWPLPTAQGGAALPWQILMATLVLALPWLARCLGSVIEVCRSEAAQRLPLTLQARGLTQKASLSRGLLRPALPRLAARAPRDLAWLLVGTMIGGELFGWPTMGRYLLSVLPRNAHAGLVLCSLLWYVALFLAIRLACDILVRLLAPRSAALLTQPSTSI